jgi:two-component system response regulator PilR (NtrC family)
MSSIATKRRRRVLVIDDDPAMTEWLRIVFEAEGCEVRSALIGARGEEIFRQWRPDVVLTDIELPDTDGIALLHRLKEIMTTAGHRGGGAGRRGPGGRSRSGRAFYYLRNPGSGGLIRILKSRRTDRGGPAPPPQGQVRGHSLATSSVRQEDEAPSSWSKRGCQRANILIRRKRHGQRAIANAIHLLNACVGRSSRSTAPPFPTSSSRAAFGYRKGAFTGATADKVGLFEMAEGGSLPLTKIGDAPYLRPSSCSAPGARYCPLAATG